MADQPKKPNLVKLDTKIVPTPGEPNLYVNIVTISMTPEELVIRLGLQTTENPTEAVGVGRLFMSAGHAKRMLNALKYSLDQYEAIFGTITENPEDLLTPEARKRLGLPQK